MMRGMGNCSHWPYACETPASLLSSADVCVCMYVCVLDLNPRCEIIYRSLTKECPSWAGPLHLAHFPV